MILVTGGTGFLGSHLVYELIKSGEKIRLLKRKESNADLLKRIISYYESDVDNFLASVEWAEGDVMDSYSIEDAVKEVTKIYHCAAVVSFNPKERKKIYDVNIKGTANVVDIALKNKIGKLCYVSSIAAIGRTDNKELINEKTAWKNSKKNSAYANSKYEAEREVWRGIEEGLNAVIVNPSVILGPGDWYTGSAKIFSRISKGTRFYTNGVNGFVDVRDVVKIMYLLMNSNINNERFLVTSENLSYRNIFDMILKEFSYPQTYIKAYRFLLEIAWRFEYLKCNLFNSNPLITKETVNTSQNQYYYSNKKITEALQYKFIPVEDTIAYTVKLFKKRSELKEF